MNRRDFCSTMVAAVAAGVARPGVGAAQSPATVEKPAPDDPTKELGGPVRPYGERSRFEKAVRQQFPTKTNEASWTFTPAVRYRSVSGPAGIATWTSRPMLTNSVI